MSKYLSEILIIQLIATYLVILGHSYPFITPIPGWLQSTQIFIYCFHMPLFVFISGYLLIYTSQASKNNFKGFLRKRFLKLLVPYISLSLIAIIPKFYLQQYLNDSMSADWNGVIRAFLVPRENIWGHFWFLPMIFLQGLAGLILDKAFIKLNICKAGWMITTVILFLLYFESFNQPITPWVSISDLTKFSWFFSLGCTCAYFDLLNKIRCLRPLVGSIALFLISLIWFSTCDKWHLTAVTQGALAVLMIASMLLLGTYLSEKINFNKDSVYTETFIIFLLSWPCQIVINVTAERLLHLPYYLIMPLQFLAGIAGPIILIKIINYIENKYKIHWISFLLGK